MLAALARFSLRPTLCYTPGSHACCVVLVLATVTHRAPDILRRIGAVNSVTHRAPDMLRRIGAVNYVKKPSPRHVGVALVLATLLHSEP